MPGRRVLKLVLVAAAVCGLASTAIAQRAMDSRAVQGGWYANHLDPGEPLGFSGARAVPSVPPDPYEIGGFFDETYHPIIEPMDPDAPAPAVSSGEWIHDGFWYVDAIAVYMERSTGPKNSIILATEFGVTLHPQDSPFLQIPPGMDWEPGLRATLGRRIGRDTRNRDHSVEFTFFGLTHWHVAGGLQSVEGSSIFTDVDPTLSVPAFNRSALQTFDQNSDFNSYELNYRIDWRLQRDRMVYTRDSTWVREATPALLPSVYAGVRVVSINEQLRWLANSNVPVSTGSYYVVTHNNLVGPQVGFDCFHERYNWRVGVRAKASAAVNWLSQSSTVRILDANGAPLLPDRDEYASLHDASFIGEFGAIGAYQVRPNMALRVSYDLMWITNLALVQNQLTFNPGLPAEVAHKNTLFFQGLSLGFEISR